MKPSGTYEVEAIGPHRLIVRLLGELREDTIESLSDQVLPQLRKIGTGGELIMDLQQMTSCSTDARMRLAEFQRGIAGCDTRTAFVANRPRFRGVGLWVAHVSEDPNARAFHQMHQAQSWLGNSEGRLTSLTNYLTRALKGKGQGPVRRSSEEVLSRLSELRDSADEDEEEKP